ncbi:MAG: flagellar hook-length control protein FliK, partial [Halocynthiibacter sp.]
AEFGKVDFGRPLEIALSPEELGRVRMTLHAQDTSLLVSIEAERFETAELMRRHMEELEQEFKELGYGDVSFDFGQSRGEDNAPRQENSTGRLEPMADDEILDVRGAEVMTGDRIDIRL